jgi:hypothetical protein
MRAFCYAVLSAILLFGQSARAQQATVTGAEMQWYGVYTVGEFKEVKDPNSATGTRLVSSGITGPATNSDRIAVRDGIRFGFGYRLLGRPGSATVPIVHATEFSGAGGLGGTGKNSEKINYNLGINQRGLFIGRKMGDAASEPTGVYKFQVWYKNRILLEKQITIYRP